MIASRNNSDIEIPVAASAGEIHLNALPVELHDALSKFDVDGNGFIDASELLRASEMYEESKNENKRLMKVIGGLFLVLICVLVAIGCITNLVVQNAKETVQDPTGVTLVAGTTKVASMGLVTESNNLFDAFSFDFDKLDATTTVRVSDANDDVFSFRPISWAKMSTYVVFTTFDKATIKVTSDHQLTVTDVDGKLIVSNLTPSALQRRLTDSKKQPQFTTKAVASTPASRRMG